MLYVSHYTAQLSICFIIIACVNSYFKYKNEMQSNKLNISSLKLCTWMFEISRRYKTETQLCVYKD
jgi:hypothetical protein